MPAALRRYKTGMFMFNPFMGGSCSELPACAESAPHSPSYLPAGAEQRDQTGPSLAARVVLSFSAAKFAVPLSPRRRGGKTLRDTARFTPSSDAFLLRPLTRCVWGGAGRFVGVARAATGPQNAPEAVFSAPKVPKSGEGLRPFEPRSKGGTPPLRNPPVLHCFSGQCGRNSGHFLRELLLGVHGRDGLSRPSPRPVRRPDAVGGA